MFGSKPSYVLLVQRNGLLLQNRQAKGPRLTFDDTILKNVEVVDRAKFIAQSVPFLASLKNQRVVVVLDRPVVFDSSTTVDDATPVAKAIELFRASVPLDEAKRMVLTRHDAKQLSCFAVNSELLSALREALEKVGAKIVTMSPLAAYSKPSQTLNKQGVVAHLLDDRRPTEDVNFIKQ